jgi:hypothetical protein
MTYEQAKRVFQKTRGYASVDDLPLPYQLGNYKTNFPINNKSQVLFVRTTVDPFNISVDHTVGAATAGAIAAAVTSPLDIIKTRIQVVYPHPLPPPSHERTTTLSIIGGMHRWVRTTKERWMRREGYGRKRVPGRSPRGWARESFGYLLPPPSRWLPVRIFLT